MHQFRINFGPMLDQFRTKFGAISDQFWTIFAEAGPRGPGPRARGSKPGAWGPGPGPEAPGPGPRARPTSLGILEPLFSRRGKEEGCPGPRAHRERVFGDAPLFLVERLKLLFRCASWSCSILSGPQAYWKSSSFLIAALSSDAHQLDLINNIFYSWSSYKIGLFSVCYLVGNIMGQEKPNKPLEPGFLIFMPKLLVNWEKFYVLLQWRFS